jgi:hypothetical protein
MGLFRISDGSYAGGAYTPGDVPPAWGGGCYGRADGAGDEGLLYLSEISGVGKLTMCGIQVDGILLVCA